MIQKDQHIHRRIFIAGATGFCGSAVVQRLAKRNDLSVYAHIRPESKRLHLVEDWTRNGVTPVQCPWSEIKEALIQIQPEVMMSFIGTTKRQFRQDPNASYQFIDCDLNVELIDIAKSIVPSPLFIYLSSMGVEWSRFSRYLQARATVEDTLKKSDLPSYIVRTGLLTGEQRDENRPMERYAAWISYPLAHLISSLGYQKGADRIKPLDAPDVAQFIDLMLQKTVPDESVTVEIDQIHQMLRSTLRHE